MEEKENLTAARKTYSVSGFALLAALLVPLVISLLMGWLSTTAEELFENRFFVWAISMLPVYGVGIPLGLWLLSRLPKDHVEPKKMPLKHFFIALIMCFPMMLGGNILGNLAAQIFSGGRSSNNVVELISQQDPLMMLSMIILAPLLEELFFRKFLIDRTLRFGEKNAVFFSALVFGLFHGNLYQIFYAFGIGLIFGYIYVRTRNIRYTMAMHFAINFFGGVVGAFVMGSVDEQMLEKIMSQDTAALVALAAENPQAMISFYISMIPLMLQGFLNIGLAIAGVVLLGMRKKEFIFAEQPQQVSGKEGRKAILLNAGVMLFILAALVETIIVLIKTCG